MDTMRRLAGEIEQACAKRDRPRAAELSAELIEEIRRAPGPLDEKLALRPLKALQRKRYFDLEERVADALIQAGCATDEVERRYAQALIDGGSRTAALLVLERLVARAAPDTHEGREARGLLGRARKQLYVDADEPKLERNRQMLRDAVASYHDVYAKDATQTWHGINVVACLARAEADGVDVPGYRSPVEIAEELLTLIGDMDDPDTWRLATAVEACVALDRPDEARDWAVRYTASAWADAFELASTLRQLTEVWRLDALSDLGGAVLPVIRDALLDKEGGFFELSPKEVAQSADALERVLGSETYKSLTWYTGGVARARGVARLGIETERGLGTGFLVRGADLDPRLGDELFLLTNAHVVSDDPAHRPAIPDYRDAQVTFEAHDGAAREVYRVTRILGRSSPAEYDFALLALDRPVTCEPPVEMYPAAYSLPLNDGEQRVYIIGHPGGGSLSFSLHDNLLLDYDDRLLHYRAPTEGGSSGSPVFNAQWKLIGLHHAGFASVSKLNNKGGTYAANEGISIFAIREELKKQLG